MMMIMMIGHYSLFTQRDIFRAAFDRRMGPKKRGLRSTASIHQLNNTKKCETVKNGKQYRRNLGRASRDRVQIPIWLSRNNNLMRIF